MARALGMNPKKFGKLANHLQQPWKAPLPEFTTRLYIKRFGRLMPDEVPLNTRCFEKQSKTIKMTSGGARPGDLSDRASEPADGNVKAVSAVGLWPIGTALKAAGTQRCRCSLMALRSVTPRRGARNSWANR